MDCGQGWWCPSPICGLLFLLMDSEIVKTWNGKWVGISVMEVFGIKYLGSDVVPPEKQLGTISMMPSDFARQYLYKVDSVDEERPSLKFGDPVMVTVAAPTTAFAKFDIEFDLFCGVYKDLVTVEWEEPGYNEVSIWEERVNSEDGTGQIAIQYGLFANATVGNVEVKLLGNYGSASVHGFIVATNSRLDRPTRGSLLFLKNSDNQIQVRDGVIPLSKSRVGVPLDSEFYVGIFLTCNNEECTTKVTFAPKEAGTYEENVCDNKVQVRVTWDADEESVLAKYEQRFQ